MSVEFLPPHGGSLDAADQQNTLAQIDVFIATWTRCGAPTFGSRISQHDNAPDLDLARAV